ncbi:alpha/beta hydrolase [Leeuwenhoekiella sp. NPDC079379]|uniref:alpha/beta hydrolase n=1 Tax=Leeuwenhoekiella sp. NPDC079379 TaxID=3364122 RepID=UPI0037C67611
MNKLFMRMLPKILGNYVNTLALVSPQAAAKKAFKIFSKPRRGKIGPHHEGFLKPNLEPALQIDELSIQPYKWPGGEKTILLVHGWESHTHRWKEMIVRLKSENYTIIAFDAPAHGYSTGKYLYVPIYDEVLSVILDKYQPDYMIGHSIGGMTVLFNQSQKATFKPKKLVVLGAPDRLESILIDYQKILNLSDRVMNALENYFLKRFNFKTTDFSSSVFAKNIETPALIIHDKDDTITPVSGSKSIHATYKNSEYIETKGLNHSLYDSKVNDQIVDFLKR